MQTRTKTANHSVSVMPSLVRADLEGIADLATTSPPRGQKGTSQLLLEVRHEHGARLGAGKRTLAPHSLTTQIAMKTVTRDIWLSELGLACVTQELMARRSMGRW